MPVHPNDKKYRLQWPNGALYTHHLDHRTEFTLAEAMRIASFEQVSVVDPETGQVLWVGGPAQRS